jgi:large subunit ribosomal protein L3
MGGLNVTTQNLLIERIDTALNVLYVRGAVPGAPGAFVRVSDALKKVGWKAQAREKRGLGLEKGEVLEGIKGLPMPTATVEQAKSWPRELQRAGAAK